MDGARNDEDLPRPPKNPPAIHNRRRRLHHQAQPPLQCPRCDSFNTKFCYFNNYSFSQPRYFCKSCRRYWTHGGTLRTIPIGGGCRKNKRPRITAPPPPPPSLSSLSSNLINPIITQGLSTNMFSGQSSRPVLPSLGGSFYSDGSYVSTLAAMQSLPTGINQGAAMMGGGGRFLQGMTFPTLKSHVPPHQHLPPPSLSRFFPPQQSLVPPAGRFSSWAQSVINAGAASSSAAANSGLWSGGDGSAASAGEPVDPSFGSNQWPDNLGFNPSQ